MTARKWATISTTSLMRQACEKADGDVAQAIAILRGGVYDHPNAASAIRVILMRVKGAPRLYVDARTASVVGTAQEFA